MSDRIIISISINLKDETECKLLEHVDKKGNRSKFLKRLIYDDLMQVHRQITTTTHFVEPETIDSDLDAMQGFL